MRVCISTNQGYKGLLLSMTLINLETYLCDAEPYSGSAGGFVARLDGCYSIGCICSAINAVVVRFPVLLLVQYLIIGVVEATPAL